VIAVGLIIPGSPIVLEVVVTPLVLLETLGVGERLVRLLDVFEVRVGANELVVLVPSGAAVVEFWNGPGQWDPTQLLTGGLLVV
jgi:hypothetical protein